MSFSHAWRAAPPDELGERARAAWARGDGETVAAELVAAAQSEGDPAYLAPVIESDSRLLDDSYLAAHADAISALPSGPVKDIALAFLAVRDDSGERGTLPAYGAVTALLPDAPRTAAAVAISVGIILGDRGRWADAASFLSLARDGVRRVQDAESAAAAEELWFGMMALAVLVEWNTFAGTADLDALAAALAVPRARNLLRTHHAGALVAMGTVLSARGDFGAGVVGIARGTRLFPDGSPTRASSDARLALARYRQGDWHAARLAGRAVAEGLDPSTGWARSLAAAVATLEPAVGGELSQARTRIALAEEALAAHPSVQADVMLLHARIAFSIGANDWNGMIQLLERAEEPGYRRIYTDHEWRALWGMALRNSGRLPRYRELIDEWGGVEGGPQHPYYWAHRALLAQIDGDGPAAIEAARRTRDLTSEGDDPLGRTWARIVVGTIVSLYGDPTEGMESYEAARAELIELGADGFVRLCTRIIEGTAGELARVSGDALSALTAQQRRVAELVAEGYTSAEIGQILYLSKKTIDFHVANIVSRLGLSNRRELARRLTRPS